MLTDRLELRLNAEQIAALDAARGLASRSAYIRHILNQALGTQTWTGTTPAGEPIKVIDNGAPPPAEKTARITREKPETSADRLNAAMDNIEDVVKTVPAAHREARTDPAWDTPKASGSASRFPDPEPAPTHAFARDPMKPSLCRWCGKSKAAHQ